MRCTCKMAGPDIATVGSSRRVCWPNERRGHACYGGMSNFRFPDDDVLAEGGLLKNTGNTATVRHAGRYFALLEAGPPTEFDHELATLGEYDLRRPPPGADDRTPEDRSGHR